MRFALLMSIALFYLATSSFASDTLQPKHVPAGIYFMPLQAIPLDYTGGITLGAELPLCNRFTFTGEGSLYYNSVGYMMRVNLKYYFKQSYINRHIEQHYVAVEYGYKTQAYDVSDNLLDSALRPGASVNYSVFKFANTVNLKWGTQVCYYRWLYFDAYAGLGIRYKVVRNSLPDGFHSSLYSWGEGYIDQFTNNNYVGFIPTFTFGIKLGYRFM